MNIKFKDMAIWVIIITIYASLAYIIAKNIIIGAIFVFLFCKLIEKLPLGENEKEAGQNE